MAFNFPNGATNGQKYTADNGLVYVYNGQVWNVDGVGTISSMDTRYLTIDGDNVVSGSSQLTSSFDERYTLSGSVQPLPSGLVSGSSQVLGGSGIYSSSAQLPSGIISGSTQLTASYDTRYTLSGSVLSGTTPAGTISGSSQLTASFDTRYMASSSVTITGTTTTNLIKYTRTTQQSELSNGSVVICNVLENSLGTAISANTSTGQITLTAGKTYRLMAMVPNFTTSGNPWPQFCWYNETTAAYIGNSSMTYPPNSAAAFGAFGGPAEAVITTNTTTIVSFRLQGGATGLSAIGGNGDFATAGSYPWIDIEEIGSTFALNGLGTMQISGSLITTGSLTSIGGITGSIAATNGVISGSSQLTSSFDTRYTLSGSVQPLPNGLISGSSQLPSGIVSGSSQLTASYDTRYTLSGSVVSGTTPAGTISGSSQLTSSFDGRYVQTGSFNTLTASFNSFTASAQSVTTGSNTFNGTQTITGSLNITTGNIIASAITANTSSLYLTSGSNLYVQNNGIVEITGSMNVSGAITGSLTGSVFGIGNVVTFSSSVDTRLDTLESSTITKASGMVAAGTFVTLDNLKCTVTTSSNRGLSIAAVSTTFEADLSGWYAASIGSAGGSTNNISYTTTASSSLFNWNFVAHGDTAHYHIRDKTNNRFYRVTMMIGIGYDSNFISIERLF
jgi:hypothetical protein